MKNMLTRKLMNGIFSRPKIIIAAMESSMSTDLKKPNSATKELSNFLDKIKPQLELALPKHLTADRMARLALTAFSTTPALQNCDHKSIAASIMIAGQLGLEPGVNGAGYLIPYGKTCTFVPGWKGLVDLVSRSGRGTVFTGVIYRDQKYTYTDGARRDLVIHNETDLDGSDDITHAYAVGWVKDATMPIIDLWRVSKIIKHRDALNRQGTKHYSYKYWEMYARKIPLLQVIKYMPCSVEVANAVAVSYAAEEGRGAIIEGGIVIDIETNYEVDESTGEVTLPAISDEDFDKKTPAWKKALKSRQSAADIIIMIETRSSLTEAQKTQINSWSTDSETV